jgi:cysteinyl-tRNA synthetase
MWQGTTSADSDKLRDIVDGLLSQQIQARSAAKEAKNFATADAIRDGLKELGVTLEDSAEGVRWSF